MDNVNILLSFILIKTVILSHSGTVIPRIGPGTGIKWSSRDNSKPIDQLFVTAKVRKNIEQAYSYKSINRFN
jgi:hypothetical protein